VESLHARVDAMKMGEQSRQGTGCIREGDQAPAADQLDHPAENPGYCSVGRIADNRLTKQKPPPARREFRAI
jgi:hypothetical protein